MSSNNYWMEAYTGSSGTRMDKIILFFITPGFLATFLSMGNIFYSPHVATSRN